MKQLKLFSNYHKLCITSLLIEGQFMITSSSDGCVNITDLDQWLTFKYKFNKPIQKMELSCGKRIMIIGFSNGIIKLYKFKEKLHLDKCYGVINLHKNS